MSADDPRDFEQLFEELEVGFDAALRGEEEQQVVAALRAQNAATPLWEVLARRVGAPVVARRGATTLAGLLLASYPDFFVLRGREGSEHLIRAGVMTLTLPAAAGTLHPAPGPAAARYRLSLALRELGRRREPVRVTLCGGAAVTGTVDAVGADYVEVAEHELGEARRRVAVRGRRLVPFTTLVAVTIPPAGGDEGETGPA